MKTVENGLVAGRGAIAPIVVGRADHDLTVILPAFNEQRRLPWTLCQLAAFLNQWRVDYRVLVADDGSADGTGQSLEQRFGARFSAIHLPRHEGKGAAVRAAMLAATGRVLAFTDADLPYDLAALRGAYEQVRTGQCEAVFGARDIKGSAYAAPRSAPRRIATWAFAGIVKGLIGGEVTDTQCGLKVFSRRAALEIFARATLRGFAFDVEVVLLARQLGLVVGRVPVTLINEYDSTLSLRRHALPMAWDVLRLFLRTQRQHQQPSPEFSGPGWGELLASDRGRWVA